MDASIIDALRTIAGACNEMTHFVNQLDRIADALDRLADCVREDDKGDFYLCISPEID